MCIIIALTYNIYTCTRILLLGGDYMSDKKTEKARLLAKWQSMPYHNRELSSVDFNKRVLEEAVKKANTIFCQSQLLT